MISSFACSALYDSLLACLALSLTQHVDSLRSNRRSAGCAAPLPLIPRHTALPVPYGSTTDRRRHRRALGSGAAHTHTQSQMERERESSSTRPTASPRRSEAASCIFSKSALPAPSQLSAVQTLDTRESFSQASRHPLETIAPILVHALTSDNGGLSAAHGEYMEISP